MIIIGCDPGNKGAFCTLDIRDGNVNFFDMPVTCYSEKEGRRRTVLDEAGLRRLILSLAGPHVAMVICEFQQPFPQCGGVSGFRFGYSYGVLVTTIQNIPSMSLEFCKPREWKKFYKLVRGDDESYSAFKNRSRLLALQLFPGAAESLRLKKHEGRAEALLLCEFARRHILRKYIPGYKYKRFVHKSKDISRIGK